MVVVLALFTVIRNVAVVCAPQVSVAPTWIVCVPAGPAFEIAIMPFGLTETLPVNVPALCSWTLVTEPLSTRARRRADVDAVLAEHDCCRIVVGQHRRCVRVDRDRQSGRWSKVRRRP